MTGLKTQMRINNYIQRARRVKQERGGGDPTSCFCSHLKQIFYFSIWQKTKCKIIIIPSKHLPYGWIRPAVLSQILHSVFCGESNKITIRLTSIDFFPLMFTYTVTIMQQCNKRIVAIHFTCQRFCCCAWSMLHCFHKKTKWCKHIFCDPFKSSSLYWVQSTRWEFFLPSMSL